MNIEWIECNLPWYGKRYEGPSPDEDPMITGASCLEIQDELKVKFGMNDLDIESIYDKHYCGYGEMLDQIMRKQYLLRNDTPEMEYAEAFSLAEASLDLTEDYKIVRDAEELALRMNDWKHEHPVFLQWIADRDKAHEEFLEKEKQARKEFVKDTFPGRGLAVPGTLIETNDGNVHLIGTMTPEADVCGDFHLFNNDTVIKRYAVVFDHSPFQKTISED